MTALITAVVVDDELRAREGLCALLKADGRVRVVGACGAVEDAVAAVRRLEPDVLFLDIALPGGSGFEVLADEPKHARPLIVFVTAYEQHALRAFDVGAVDYLLKPFTDERLAHAIDRLVERRAEPRDRLLEAALSVLREREPGLGEPTQRIAVRRPGKVDYVPIDQITRMRADGDYVEVRTRAGRTDLVRGPLAHLVAGLDGRRFVRTHRSWVVSLDDVRTLRARAGGSAVVELADGEVVPVSARRRAHVEAALAGRSWDDP